MSALEIVREEFGPPSGHLDTASRGLIPIRARRAAVLALSEPAPPPRDGDPIAESRRLFARSLGVDPERVAVGSQTSVASSLVAGNVRHLDAGDEVLCVTGDFSSVVSPFAQSATSGDYTVRHVTLPALADAITDRTAVVAFSAVQSADGAVAEWDAVIEAARRHDAWTYADLTQAVGWMPFGAQRMAGVDVTVTAAYKWLWTPRGVTLSTFSERALERLRPVHTSWFSGENLDESGYGPSIQLAADARRFDVSPAWPQYDALEQSLALQEELGIAWLHEHSVGLANRLRESIGMPLADSAIVSVPDADDAIVTAARRAGLRLSSRQGAARFAFHAYNTETEVDAAIEAVLDGRS